MESPITFRNEGQQIVGILHLPSSSSSSGRFPAVVLSHGFTGQKVEAHRLFVKTARELAARGIVALRFDFRGCGDSEGEFSDMTVETEVSDALAAVKFLRERPEVDPNRVGVIGLSLGGAVAMLVAARLSSGPDAREPLQSLVLWAAPAEGCDIIKMQANPVALESLQKTGIADHNANPVSKRFLDGFEKLVLTHELKKSDCPLLIVHGQNDLSVPLAHADRIEAAARQPGRQVEKLVIKGADHTFNRLDWQQQVIEATVRWFGETL